MEGYCFSRKSAEVSRSTVNSAAVDSLRVIGHHHQVEEAQMNQFMHHRVGDVLFDLFPAQWNGAVHRCGFGVVLRVENQDVAVAQARVRFAQTHLVPFFESDSRRTSFARTCQSFSRRIFCHFDTVRSSCFCVTVGIESPAWSDAQISNIARIVIGRKVFLVFMSIPQLMLRYATKPPVGADTVIKRKRRRAYAYGIAETSPGWRIDSQDRHSPPDPVIDFAEGNGAQLVVELVIAMSPRVSVNPSPPLVHPVPVTVAAPSLAALM